MELTGVLVFLTLVLLFYSLVLRITASRRRIVRRLAGLAMESGREPTGITSRRPQRSLPLLRGLESTMNRGEFQLSPREFLLRWGLVTLLAMLLAYVFRGPWATLVAAVASLVGTVIYLRVRGNRRLARFEAGLGDLLTITANSLRAGYSFVQAIQVVAEDVRGPMQQELTRILEEMNVGVPLEQAFRGAAARIQSEDFNLIVTAILIQRQVGGNLAEVLDEIAETIRHRTELKEEVKVLTSQGRLSTVVFMVLPVGLATIMYFMSPSYVGILFHSKIGIGMLIAAALLQVVGYFIIRRVIDIEL